MVTSCDSQITITLCQTSEWHVNCKSILFLMLVPHLSLDDREDVCRPKTEEELLCDPSLRQKALLLTKTSEIPIYKTEVNALVKVIFFFP